MCFLKQIERKYHIIGGEGLAIRPLDVFAQLESQGQEIAAPALRFGQPGNQIRFDQVVDHQWLKNAFDGRPVWIIGKGIEIHYKGIQDGRPIQYGI